MLFNANFGAICTSISADAADDATLQMSAESCPTNTRDWLPFVFYGKKIPGRAYYKPGMNEMDRFEYENL